MQLLRHGQAFRRGRPDVRKAGGDNPLEYFKFKMTEVFITSVSGRAARRVTTSRSENVSLNFAKVEFDVQAAEGEGRRREPPDFAYDMHANKDNLARERRSAASDRRPRSHRRTRSNGAGLTVEDGVARQRRSADVVDQLEKARPSESAADACVSRGACRRATPRSELDIRDEAGERVISARRVVRPRAHHRDVLRARSRHATSALSSTRSISIRPRICPEAPRSAPRSSTLAFPTSSRRSIDENAG